MPPMTLNELADAVERAEGPNYALDCEIWDAIYPGERDERFVKVNASYGNRLGPADKDGYVQPLRAFTASLDAAMTLAPSEGERVIDLQTGFKFGKPFAWALAVFSDEQGRSYGEEGRAATPALALCAAALRARAKGA